MKRPFLVQALVSTLRSGPAEHGLDFPPQTVNFRSRFGIRREFIDRFTQADTDHKVVALMHNSATNFGSGLELFKHDFRGATEHRSTVDDPGYLDTSVCRSEERRVGKECDRTCRSRWRP